MKSFGLSAVLVSLALGLAVDAHAKGIRSHSSSHSSSHGSSHPSDSHPTSHPAEAHASEGGGGIIRNAVARPHRSERSGNDSSSSPAPGAGEESSPARQAQQAALAKVNAEAEAAAQEKKRQQAEQAAAAALEQQKRLAAETAANERERIALERVQRQAAWEARCQIKPVMSDLEIGTCREVWTTPAR